MSYRTNRKTGGLFIVDHKSIKTLSDLLNTNVYNAYSGEALGIQNRIINYPNDLNVTHFDVLDTQREFIDSGIIKLGEKLRNKFKKEIDKSEAFHEKNGTLYDVVIDYSEYK